MDNLRREELRTYWNEENLYGEEWRDDLTPEELDYVATLDESYRTGLLALTSAILIREKVRAQFGRTEILELESVHDHCRVKLRDGRTLLARLDRDNSLRLDEIDGVC